MGIGAFFIPFILFDGTKELPKKLVPVFTGFLIKIIVITICMFFVFYLFIQKTVDIMTDNGGMNWVSFVTVVFTCVIGFVLTQNAPKITQTLMTGQPQLSMGELVTAAGTLAMGTFKGAKAAGHITKEGSRKVAQGAVNAHGTAAKMNSARKAASSSAKDLGASVAQQRMAGAKGMFAAVSTDLKDKVRSAGNNFLHGGGKAGPGGHGGGAGGGAQAHQRSGQNTSRELGTEDSRALNNTSNPTFQGAVNVHGTAAKINSARKDTANQSNVNMTRKEFYDEKRDQGKNIGNTVALNMMTAAEKKEQAMKKDTSLGDKLTDGVRASE